jgi:hypothetical protein
MKATREVAVAGAAMEAAPTDPAVRSRAAGMLIRVPQGHTARARRGPSVHMGVGRRPEEQKKRLSFLSVNPMSPAITPTTIGRLGPTLKTKSSCFSE